MPIGKCKLCNKVGELQDSHVLPNALFKNIFRANKGKAIHFNDDKHTFVRYESKSWSEFMLCQNCERHINESYEQESIAAIRNCLSSVRINKTDTGITFANINQKTLQLFLVSILWRAAASTHQAYEKVYLPEPWKEEIRISILENKKVRSSLVGIQLRRLSDPSKDGFSLASLKQLLISPFFRNHGNRFSFCFLIEGFFVEIFVPGIQAKRRNDLGIVAPNKSILFVPYQDIFDIPELVQIMVSGYGKFVDGKSRIKS
ncbi:hypothetical protein [Imhoffiella purpurea]|uniref:hypothetical protein n=1 Tax=Imhoffiella purpurea TaxID=1249627 RepID=UPI0012FD37F8|nr:hypothetical protein [Imhoffiella purpurea]